MISAPEIISSLTMTPFSFSTLENETNIKLLNYEVPWRLIHSSTMTVLKNGGKLPTNLYNNFVHFVADDLRLIKKKIENKHITSICVKIAELYENTFKNKSMSGKPMSDKPVTLISKVQRRLIYLNGLEEATTTTKTTATKRKMNEMIKASTHQIISEDDIKIMEQKKNGYKHNLKQKKKMKKKLEKQ